jgi:hypothetical protein
MAYPTRRDRIVYVLLSPLVLAWTGLNAWWLATEGGIPVLGDSGQVWAHDGLQFWVTLGLYAVLAFAAVVTLVAFVRSWRRKDPH